MSRQVIVLRHEIPNRKTSDKDPGLSPKGIENARVLCQKFLSEDMSLVLCSPLKRAQQTAGCFENRVIIKNELREWEVDQQYLKKILPTSLRALTGAESLEQVKARVSVIKRDLETEDCKTCLLVTHALVSLVLVGVLLETDVAEIPIGLRLKYGHYGRLIYKQDKWHVVEWNIK